MKEMGLKQSVSIEQKITNFWCIFSKDIPKQGRGNCRLDHDALGQILVICIGMYAIYQTYQFLLTVSNGTFMLPSHT